MNLLALGDATAAHLGLNVSRSRLLFYVVASLITGATVAACGIIGFVGLIVPHAVRLLVGPDHRRLVPASALAGAAFLMLADCLARTLLARRGGDSHRRRHRLGRRAVVHYALAKTQEPARS